VGVIKHGAPQGSVLVSLFFIPYKNYLSVIINRKLKLVLCAESNDFTFTNSKLENVKTDIQVVFEHLNKWLKAISVQAWTGL
jgi:hypothetical protein